MEYSTKDFYYKICEIVSLKKHTNQRLAEIEEKIAAYVKEAPQARDEKQCGPEENISSQDQLKKWMSRQEVMDYLKISESSYYRWKKSGKLEPINGFGQDRYLKEDIIALLVTR